MGISRKLYSAGVVIVLGGLFGQEVSGQEIIVPNRRHDTSVFQVVVDDLRGASLRGGGVNYGRSRTLTAGFSVLTPLMDTGRAMWDTGFEWKRMEFSYHVEPGSPGALQMMNVPLGASWELGEVTTLGVQIKPGIYSDNYDLGLSDVNVPTGIRLFHEHHPDLLWMIGLQFDPWHEIPVIPDIGFRWRFWYDFVLDARLPNPRLEYDLSDRWTTFAGFEWRGGTYRVSRNIVAGGGLPGTDNSTLTYRDLRVGGGFRFTWDDEEENYVSVSAGYSFQRRINYDRGGQTLKAGGAPYVRLVLHTEW